MQPRLRVMAVDDDPELLRILVLGLQSEGIEVVSAGRVPDAMRLLREDRLLDAAILDIDLSRTSTGSSRGDEGLTLLRSIREVSDLPVIMLSSTDVEDIKVHALNLGADDYMTKPFGPREIVARLSAILRRRQNHALAHSLRCGPIRVEPDSREVYRNDEKIELTQIEFSILWALAQARGRVLSRRQILDAAWGANHFADERVVDVHVRHLRKKLEVDPSHPEIVVTVRGAGYRCGSKAE